MVEVVLTEEDVERFVRDGAVLLKGAFSRELAEECRDLLWTATGCDEHDPSTWSRPVVRIDGRGDAPFVAAANTERLHAAFDRLAGLAAGCLSTGSAPFRSDFLLTMPRTMTVGTSSPPA